MTRTVRDAALLLAAMAGVDAARSGDDGERRARCRRISSPGWIATR